MNKIEEYKALVAERKACHLCCSLTNPVDVDGGQFDSDQIGPWSWWQGNLDASLMIVGQDWDSRQNFIDYKGREPINYTTNLALIKLVGIAGFSIGDPNSQEGRNVAFFTNAVLCLKEGKAQAGVWKRWFNNCTHFSANRLKLSIRLWLSVWDNMHMKQFSLVSI